MEPSSGPAALHCTNCGERHDPRPGAGTCPACGGTLDPEYDHDALAASIDVKADRDAVGFLERTGLDSLLPLAPADRLDTGAGETPLVAVPTVADALGLGALAVKDEGCNPTGSLADREMALAVAAASAAGVTDVGLPTMGNAGQAAAVAAARAGLASHSFVPSRTPFVNKATINVHGGDMTVVEGRYRDAVAAFAEATATADWHSLAPFETPYRHDGAKPVAYEIVARRGWTVPDAVVVPAGQVTSLVGLHRGFADLAALGLTGRVPRLVAAEAAGCPPLTRAVEADQPEPVAVEHPDTVCGTLEIPDPAGGRLALDALRASDGTAVASGDDEILAGAATLAEAGGPASVTGGAAVAALESLLAMGDLDPGTDVVLVNPVSANKEADLMRSHLMSRGR